MEIEKSDVKKHLEENTDFEDNEIIERFEGEHNYSFVFESERGKYVFRARKEASSEHQLRNERRILEFLNEQGIEFAPETVYYDIEEGFHIVEFVGESEVRLDELIDNELEAWTETISELHSLKFEDFKKFCKERNYEFNKPETRKEKIERIEENLEQVENVNQSLLKWTKDKLEEVREEMNESHNRAGLSHEDLQNSTSKTENNIYIIDWEFAKFNHHPESDLADVFIDEELTEKQIERVMQTYRQKTNFVGSLENEVQKAKKLRLLFQISWSLNRFKDTRDSKYVEYAEERKNKLEKIA
jgi:aminoglycoside phosphotransferase (APT) family kinase protein